MHLPATVDAPRWNIGGARNGGANPGSNGSTLGEVGVACPLIWRIILSFVALLTLILVIVLMLWVSSIRMNDAPHCFRILGTGPDVLPGPGEHPPFAPEFGGIIKGEIEVGHFCIRWKLTYINMTSDPLQLHLHGPLVGNDTEHGYLFVDLGVEEIMPIEGQPGNGTLVRRGCLDVTYEQEFAIMARPDIFYLDVHTDDSPDGALRSPLGTRCGGGI